MRNFIGLGIMVCSCVACTTPIVPQPATQSYSPAAATAATVSPTCRPVNATANVDGSPQNLTGLACKQPDGTWQIQQPDAGIDMPPPSTGYADYADDYPYYPYYDPWFYGPLALGFGGSIVFVNHFHHFHHGDYGHFGGHGGFHNGFHGGHGFHGGGFHGGGSFPGGGGFHGGGGRR